MPEFGHSPADPPMLRIVPPYDRLAPLPLAASPQTLAWGDAVLWTPRPDRRLEAQLRFIAARPPGVACFIVLPPPAELGPIMPVLRRLRPLHPTGILPDTPLTPALIRSLLRAAPPDIAAAAGDYVAFRLGLEGERILDTIETVLRASATVRSIAGLARLLCVSRRTLGRHFRGAGLPAPSHWLQFARLFRVSLRLRTDRTTIARAAHQLGYPDGFTMSNQMKRLIGYRPSQLNELLGWEWLIEAWLDAERRAGNIDLKRYPQVGRTSNEG